MVIRLMNHTKIPNAILAINLKKVYICIVINLKKVYYVKIKYLKKV